MTPESAIASNNTILIIDDSPNNLRVLSKTLATHGYTVRCATNGPMAFISIQNAPPDLILLDIRMPEMSGYEVCQKLKQYPDSQDIPIIFLSALSEVEDIVKAFQVGGIDYITKPFQTEEVLARIRNQLTIRKLKKQLSEQNKNLLREIDEHKKTEQALHQEIQRRILVEASLQDAKNAAEAANYAKSEFLAQMSHELRTPLNIILGFTNILKSDSSLNTEHIDSLSAIEKSSYQLLKLLNNILSIAHSKSPQLSLIEQEFNLYQLLDSIISVWEPKALQKGLHFEYQRNSDVPQYIQSDESKIRQILMSLLSNALNSTENGSIMIKVDVNAQSSAESNGTCQLGFEVQNTSTKFSFNEVEFSFLEMPESESERTLVQELKLNFFLIQQFAQLMGGDVIFKSSPGQGSVVKVYLAARLTNPSSSPIASYPNSSNCPVQSVSDEGILTVEALQVVMSNDWLVQLHQAAVRGFDHQILSLLQKIPSSHAVLSKTLELWTRNFQFDRIVEITEQAMH